MNDTYRNYEYPREMIPVLYSLYDTFYMLAEFGLVDFTELNKWYSKMYYYSIQREG